MTTRDELKKKRLQAMGVVGSQMDASAAMYDRVVAAGDAVARARDAAETAHMGALDEQVRDLTEMADDMSEFEQAAPTGAGQPKPSAGIAKLSGVLGSNALDVLNAAQPQPKGWTEGNAYVGTSPPKR